MPHAWRLGPDLPALFCDDDAWAATLCSSGLTVFDPVWRLPLWSGYDDWLKSPVADLNNISSKPFAGAIVAALFLKRFVTKGISHAHIDLYGWNDQTRPGRPEGEKRSPCGRFSPRCVSGLVSLRWLIDDDSESFAGSLINGILIRNEG